jgi:hypothetical protein
MARMKKVKTKMETLTIKREIPVHFKVILEDKYQYSFNIDEKIVHIAEIRNGRVDTFWGGFHPIQIVDNKIQLFERSDGRWAPVVEKIQKAYEEFLIEKELL